MGLRIELCLPEPSRDHCWRRLLSWALLPYSTCWAKRSTSHGLCLPATFRPQGLITLSTVFSLFVRAGFVSHRQRSWDSPFEASSSAKGNRTVSGPDGPTYRWPKARRHPKVLTGPRRRFLGFDPFASSWRNQALLTPSPLDAPLGFGPSRVRRHQPRPGFRPDSSYALSHVPALRRTWPAP